jgi:predicted Zn finger-like uncharacterized protein
MIVTCPSCSSRYQLKKERLPSKSGHIKCPKCSHLFRVLIEAEPEDNTDDQISEPKAVPQKTTPLPPAITSTVPADKEEKKNAAPGTDVIKSRPGNLTDTPVKRTPSTGPAWKIKNTVGLIYDFQDLDSLVQWLSNRDKTDDLLISPDGAEPWLPIKSVEVVNIALAAVKASELTTEPETQPNIILSAAQQDTNKSTTSEALPRLPPTQPVEDRPYKPRPNLGYNTGSIRLDSQHSGLAVYIGIAFTSAFLLLCLLQLIGWIDFQEMLGLRGKIPLQPEVTITSSPVPDEVGEADRQAPQEPVTPYNGHFPGQQRFDPLGDIALEDSAQERRSGNNPNQLRIEAIKRQASQALNWGNIEMAIQLISSATQLAPNDSELVCLLADLHQRNSALTEAELLRVRCEEIISLENRQ